MPQLKQLSCCLQWSDTGAPFQEHGTVYGDGVVETFVVVPNQPCIFTIHLRSHGFIHEGLAMVAFIDGNYQSNRCRVNLQPAKKDQPAWKTEIDFLLRQKEKSQGNGLYMGRQWRFDNHNIVADPTEAYKEGHFSDLGTIEVIILRCHARYSEEAEYDGSSSGEDSDIFGQRPSRQEIEKTRASTAANTKKKVTSEPTAFVPTDEETADRGLGFIGLFDGANDEGLGNWRYVLHRPFHNSYANPSSLETPPDRSRRDFPMPTYHYSNGYPTGPGEYSPHAIPPGEKRHVHFDYGPRDSPQSHSQRGYFAEYPSSQRPRSHERMRPTGQESMNPPYSPQQINLHPGSPPGHRAPPGHNIPQGVPLPTGFYMPRSSQTPSDPRMSHEHGERCEPHIPPGYYVPQDSRMPSESRVPPSFHSPSGANVPSGSRMPQRPPQYQDQGWHSNEWPGFYAYPMSRNVSEQTNQPYSETFPSPADQVNTKSENTPRPQPPHMPRSGPGHHTHADSPRTMQATGQSTTTSETNSQQFTGQVPEPLPYINQARSPPKNGPLANQVPTIPPQYGSWPYPMYGMQAYPQMPHAYPTASTMHPFNVPWVPQMLNSQGPDGHAAVASSSGPTPEVTNPVSPGSNQTGQGANANGWNNSNGNANGNGWNNDNADSGSNGNNGGWNDQDNVAGNGTQSWESGNQTETNGTANQVSWNNNSDSNGTDGQNNNDGDWGATNNTNDANSNNNDSWGNSNGANNDDWGNSNNNNDANASNDWGGNNAGNQVDSTWDNNNNYNNSNNQNQAQESVADVERDLYGPHGRYYSYQALHINEPKPDAEEEPRFDVPRSVAKERASTKQVQPGPGYRYFKKSLAPEYIDTLEQPYARFVFKYRTKDQLQDETGIEIEVEPSSDQEVTELQHLDKQALVEMLMRAKSALGGKIPSPPSTPTEVLKAEITRPVGLPAPNYPYLKYSLPALRPVNPNTSRRLSTQVQSGQGSKTKEKNAGWGTNNNTTDNNWSNNDNNNNQSWNGAPGNWDGASIKSQAQQQPQMRGPRLFSTAAQQDNQVSHGEGVALQKDPSETFGTTSQELDNPNNEEQYIPPPPPPPPVSDADWDAACKQFDANKQSGANGQW